MNVWPQIQDSRQLVIALPGAYCPKAGSLARYIGDALIIGHYPLIFNYL